jgi:LacI family transcriptional regulator
MARLQRPIPPAEKRDRVAKELGISARTVQRVIEGGPNVSPETRQSVSAELERLGFGRLPEAVVGLVIPDLQNPFFVELADSLESRLAQQEMQLIIATSNDYERRENLHIRWMIGMRASGVFYCQNPPFQDSLHTLTAASNLAVVLIDIDPVGMDMDAVLADSYAGIERAVAHLAIENQHERIGFLAGPEDSSTAQARRRAFDQAMKEHGLGDPPVVLKGDYTFESGRHAALDLVKRKRQGLETPTAIVSANDLMAIGLIQGLGKIDSDTLGLRVPEQLSVVGFDNISNSEMITPELTSVDQRVDEIAERAVRMMVRRIDMGGVESDAPPQIDRVTPEIKFRQSVSRCADSPEGDRASDSFHARRQAG